MKIIRSLLVLAFAALTLTLSAGDDPKSLFQITTEIVDENVVSIQLSNLQQMHTTITIKSLDGKTTYHRWNVRNHNGYRQTIDLSALQHGRYIFEVKQGKKGKQQIILIREQQLQLSQISE